MGEELYLLQHSLMPQLRNTVWEGKCQRLRFAFVALNGSESKGEGLFYMGTQAPEKFSALPPPSGNATA